MSFLLESLLRRTRELYGRIPMPSADSPFEPQLAPEPVLPPPPAPSTNPYYPPGVVVPGYAPNEATVLVLLPALAGMLGAALLAGLLVARRRNPGLTRVEAAVFCWFLMSGCLHCFFEGYFVFNHTTVASSQHVFAQLWKEYALSDSRYLTSDPFMLSVEALTVFLWGPLCLATAAAGAARSPLRHPLRVVACMAHLYGVALYYATSLAELWLTGRAHSRPEPLYFWGYYVGFNLPWVVVPGILLYRSLAALSRKVRSLQSVKAGLDGFQARNGDVTTVAAAAAAAAAARAQNKRDPW